MAEDQGKQEEEKFDFTAEGEVLGYIGMDQAQVRAMRVAAETPGEYGSAYSGVSMAFDVAQSEDREDHYVITLSFRPQGDFSGRPGQEQFFIEKEGSVAHRQVLSLPRVARPVPVVPMAIGLAVAGVVAVIAVFAAGGFGSGDGQPVAVAPPPTMTPIPATQTPLPSSTEAPAIIPQSKATLTLAPTGTAIIPPTKATRTPAPIPSATAEPAVAKPPPLTPSNTPTTQPARSPPAAPIRPPDPRLLSSPTFGLATPLDQLPPGTIVTVAGTGERGFSGDGGPATKAQLHSPQGIAVDNHGNLFIADTNNSRIRRVNADSGVITTVAGTGTQSGKIDGFPATEALLRVPYGLAVDPKGNLFIAEAQENRVRRVDVSTGIIETVAGSGRHVSGSQNREFRLTGAGDGGQASNALLWSPRGLDFDCSGNLFIADTQNNSVRRVDTNTGIITTVAGKPNEGVASLEYDRILHKLDGGGDAPSTLGLNHISDIALDCDGNLYIADAGNQRIFRLDARTGFIRTIAGGGSPVAGFSGDGGKAREATLFSPEGVAIDVDGNLFIADLNNDRIRRVDARTGIITTVAGTGVPGFSGDGGPAITAQLSSPRSIVLDNDGNLFVSEGSHRIRVVVGAATPSSPPMMVPTPTPTPTQAPPSATPTPQKDRVTSLDFENLDQGTRLTDQLRDAYGISFQPGSGLSSVVGGEGLGNTQLFGGEGNFLLIGGRQEGMLTIDFERVPSISYVSFLAGDGDSGQEGFRVNVLNAVGNVLFKGTFSTSSGEDAGTLVVIEGHSIEKVQLIPTTNNGFAIDNLTFGATAP